MANCFARVEFVKRSSGKNVCAKSAYISRNKIQFEGHKFQEAKTYNWSRLEKPAYHAILLPSHSSEELKNPEKLWNLCESFENRKNSQPAFEQVLALPDDEIINLEDRIHLLESFVKEHFIKEGFAAEVVIHQPEKKGKKDHNWHAHVLVTGRKISACGSSLESKKPREFFSKLKATKWHELWTEHQNDYFELRGLPLRVDPTGLVSQKHLGPVRMRGRMHSILLENESRKELNRVASSDPKAILDYLTSKKSLFEEKDLERFLSQHTPQENSQAVREAFWAQEDLIELLDRETREKSGKYSSRQALEEERALLRLADSIEKRKGFGNPKKAESYTSSLNQEQKEAFYSIVRGKKLCCLDGHAGTGKSRLLSALDRYYTSQGIQVRAIGPDNATASVLSSKGLSNTENIYRFLYRIHYAKESKRGEVWMVDESSKLGNRPLLELLRAAEKHQAQLIFSGSRSQLSSVERGGGFELFCARYGANSLSSIQRQKRASDLSMALAIARGEASLAIDKLYENRGLHWSETKQESLHSLISQWKRDLAHFPTGGSLIIARSNVEARVLNELAREARKELGQLGKEEYRCETKQGILFVSQGDRIRFRENDEEMGVTNGMTGTLIKASLKEFVVSVLERNGKESLIAFDPRYYDSYELAYATTSYRSQGETVERSYVSYSPGMSKQEFYVDITRHEKKVHLFVSKEEVKSLSHLKYALSRGEESKNTHHFTTLSDLKREKDLEEKRVSIEALKSSERSLDRLKGYGSSLIFSLKEKKELYWTKKKDCLADKSFYSFKKQKISSRAEVSLEPDRKPEEKQIDSLAEKSPPQEKKGVVEEYRSASKEAFLLREILALEAENEGKELKEHSSFSQLREAWRERNRQASFLVKQLSCKELEDIFGEKRTRDIQGQAERFHSFTAQKSGLGYQETEAKLLENAEALLYRLFPEGPSRREGARSLRYGRKGSLCVTLKGEKAGSFYDFEQGEGGGLLKLIEKSQNLNSKEALSFAREFLHMAPSIETPRYYQTFKTQKESLWIPLRPPSEAPKTVEALSKFSGYREEARYAYRDEEGSLLFYTVRLVDEKDPSKKIVIPLSYGYWKRGRQLNRWETKNYGDRIPYNLHLLKRQREKPILLVEGEKTADAASKLLPDFVVLTWSGGSKAVSKTGWQPLQGREVFIWPDNDQAGFQAAKELCKELKKVGVRRLELIDQESLSNRFPSKWDLADPLPKGVSQRDLRDLLLSSQSKGIDPNRLILLFGGERPHPADLSRANEVLWRVDERLRDSLEKQSRTGLNQSQINQEIISEAFRILDSEKNIKSSIEKELGIKNTLSERLAYQALLFKAEHGKEPSSCYLESVRDKIRDTSCLQEISQNVGKITEDRKIHDFSMHQALSMFLEPSSRDKIEQIRQESVRAVERLSKQVEVQRIVEDKSQEKEIILGF